MKKYKDEAFEELINVLSKYSGNGGGLHVFIKMLNENEEKFPGLKSYFIHDMNKFLTHWFRLNNEVKSCSPSLKAKILSRNFINEYYIKDFNRFIVFCYDNIDKSINPFTNRLLTRDIINHLDCIIKSIIQHKRCEIGLDNNSQKFKTA